MKNIEKYKDNVLDNVDTCSIDECLRRMNASAYCDGYNCEGCKERFLKWLFEECKEPVLDDEEREYLSVVIKPFRNKITTISKLHTYDNINYENNECIYFGMKDRRGYTLPLFKQGTMYKGMQQGRHYTLQELGL